MRLETSGRTQSLVAGYFWGSCSEIQCHRGQESIDQLGISEEDINQELLRSGFDGRVWLVLLFMRSFTRSAEPDSSTRWLPALMYRSGIEMETELHRPESMWAGTTARHDADSTSGGWTS